MADFDALDVMALTGRIETLGARLDAEVAARQELARRLVAAYEARLSHETALREAALAALQERALRETAMVAAAVHALGVHERELTELHRLAHEREHRMTEDAIDKAEQALGRRLEGMNEFRAALTDVQATFARGDVMETRFQSAAQAAQLIWDGLDRRLVALDRRISTLEQGAANLAGRGAMLAILWGIIVVAASIALRFVK